MNDKCPHCHGKVDNPRYVTCSRCRAKVAAYARKKRQERTDMGRCSTCGIVKANDGFTRCLPCRAKERKEYHSRRPDFKRELKNPIRKVQIRAEYIEMLDKKAAEKGVSKQVLFEELIDRYLDLVKVWG